MRHHHQCHRCNSVNYHSLLPHTSSGKIFTEVERSNLNKFERLVKIMCKKLTVAYADLIGKRLVGWCCWNGTDYSFLSDTQIGKRLKDDNNSVNGLRLSEDGEVVIDPEFTGYLMGKSGLSFSPVLMVDDEEPSFNKYLACVKVEGKGNQRKFHFISSRCGYEVHEESQVRAMLAIIDMAGVKLDSKGKVVIHHNIDIEDEAEAPK